FFLRDPESLTVQLSPDTKPPSKIADKDANFTHPACRWIDPLRHLDISLSPNLISKKRLVAS
ncbi:MAG TPA: hypothetical protein DCQ96_13835, partial [Verrucomicrobiales bacterium]|nr:hypothetical protein [Verrucomicrobiales bacterium]